MDENLKEILEGDYHLVLISGDYHDCPSCNDGATLIPTPFWDETALLKHMLEQAGKEKMTAIWISDSWGDGDMYKYCDIKTTTGHHNVQKMEFDLPSGHVIIVNGKEGYRQLTPQEMVLYGPSKNN